MSTKYPVQFKDSKNAFALPNNLSNLVEQICTLLVNSPKDHVDFIFRKLKQHLYKKNPPYNFSAEHFYKVTLGVSRKLIPSETQLVNLAQQAIDSCKNKDQFRSVFACLFERYIFLIKTRKYTKNTFLSVNLFVADNKVEYKGKKEIDIATDYLDAQDFLEMCECTLSFDNFNNNPSKADQLEFYAEAFAKIRSVVASTTRLRFELTAVNSWGFQLKELYMPSHEILKANNIEIVAITLYPPQSVSL